MRPLLLVVASGFALSQCLWAQDTLWVPVTYYDFHPVSNDFEPSTYSDAAAGLRLGMAQDTLDEQRKPLLRADLAWNPHLGAWFRPSGGGSAAFQVDSVAFRGTWSGLTNYMARVNEWVGQAFYPADTMASLVIYDSLPFVLFDAVSRTYTYSNQRFFPLDGRGFGAEPAFYPLYGWTNPGYNFGFTMEIHRRFTYTPGMVWPFASDADLWCFIDGRLAFDLGGIHGLEAMSRSLDSLGLTPGGSYDYDLFFADRHVTGSAIRAALSVYSPMTATGRPGANRQAVPTRKRAALVVQDAQGHLSTACSDGRRVYSVNGQLLGRGAGAERGGGVKVVR